jgi:diketogulonate reductase-like aldo/keto reductase
MQVIEAHDARIPTIGLGTMTLKEDVCVQAVKTALQIGYRHLDTAAFYGNEKENGEGLRQSGVKREDVFICTKVRQGDLMPDAFAKVLEQSLANLKLPYVDIVDSLEQPGRSVQFIGGRAVQSEERRQDEASASPISPAL